MNYKPYKHLPPFKGMVLQNFPFIEEDFDAITNYQLLCKVVEYLKLVIDNEQIVEENVNSLYNALTELKNYVDNYFDNLDVQEEINNKLDEMATDGTLENIIKKYIPVLFPFDINGSMQIIKGRTNETLYTIEEITDEVNNWKNNKINKCTLTVEIQPSAEEQAEYIGGTKTLSQLTFRMFPDLSTLNQYRSFLQENGIEPYYLKIHCTFLKNTVSANIEQKMSVYSNYVNSIISDLTGYEYIGICNEFPTALEYSGITTLINNVKDVSKVLLSGIRNSYITDELLDLIDGYCPHIYTPLSMLKEQTDLDFTTHILEDSEVLKSIRDFEYRSTKPVIIGECGCQSYWSALYRPEQWEHLDSIITSGAPQNIYIKTLILVLKKYNVESINYWWSLYPQALYTIKKYKEGKYD